MKPPIDGLIERLSSEVVAVRPARLVSSWAWLMLLVLGTLLIALIPLGVRSDLSAALGNGMTGLGTLGLLIASSAAVANAVASSVPGRQVNRKISLLEAFGWSLLTIALLIGALDSRPFHAHLQAGLDSHGLECFTTVTLVAGLPGILLFLGIRRLAPLHPCRIAMKIGAAATLLAALCVALHCSMDEPLHWMVWHFSPIVPVAALASVLGSRLPRW